MAEYKNITGGAELQAFLDQLPAKLEANVMRSALAKGAKVIRDEAKANVPVDSGDLRKSIRVSSGLKRGVASATVKAGDKKAWYANIIEFTGAAAHLIKVSKKDRPTRITRSGRKTKVSIKTMNRMIAKGSLSIGGNFVGPVVSHPGIKAKPFLRPALDSKASAAIQAVGDQVRKRLTKEGFNAPAIEVDD